MNHRSNCVFCRSLECEYPACLSIRGFCKKHTHTVVVKSQSLQNPNHPPIETAIPISILAVWFSGLLLKWGYGRSSLLENINILAIGTTSGIVAGGTCFTMPAIYILDLHGSLGIGMGGLFLQIFLVPFRRYFVKEMHGKLPFPEGTATNDILVSGAKGGKKQG